MGAILYEMVTGSSCFLGGNVMEIWERICSGSYQPVTDHKTEIPTRMIRAIEQALVVDPEHRLQTVSELYACWCTDDAGQHVAVPGRLSLDFWPESLRSETSAMAPSWDIAPDSTGHSPERDSSTLLFVADQTTDWGEDNDSPPPTLAPPSSGSTPPPDTPSPSKPIGWMVMAAVAAGAMGVWSQRPDAEPTSPTTDVADARSAVVGNESPPMETRDSIANPESHISADHLSAQTPTNNETVGVADPAHPGLSNSIFKLSATAPKSDQQTLLIAQEALLRANYPLAERHLNALAEQHPTEPAIHSLLSLTHYFRGHLGLSAGASRRAAYLSRQQETNAAAIYQLVDRSWREPDNSGELLPKWAGLRSAESAPLVDLLYVVSSRLLLKPEGTQAQIQAIQTARPDWPVWTLLELVQLSKNGQLQDTVRVAQKALEVFPSVTALRLQLAEALIRLERFDEAKPHLVRIQTEDQNLASAHILLAAIAIAQNDEQARQTQLMIALGDETAGPEQSRFLLELGRLDAARGDLEEGLKIWDLCIREAHRTEHFNGAVHCAIAGLDGLIWLAPPDTWPEWQEQVRSTLTHPAVDPDLKQLYSIHLMMAEAIGAARSGELTHAEALLSQIEALDDSLNPLDTRSNYAREIQREIAIASRNPMGLSQLRDSFPTAADTPPLDRSCLSLWNEYRILQALDQLTDASNVAERILDGQCRPIPHQRLIDVHLQTDLAERALQEGNMEAANGYVTDFRSNWPKPNEDLPLVARIQAVEKQVGPK